MKPNNNLENTNPLPGNLLKRKNPRFIRQCAYNISSLGIKWRKPKGIHSKMRMSIKGHRSIVKIGYRNDKRLWNTYRGLQIGYINNLNDLEKVNPKTHVIIVASNLGFKKKEIILNKAKELGIKILNIHRVDDYIKRFRESREKDKQRKVVTKKKEEQAKKEGKKEEKEQKEQSILDEKEKHKKEEQEKRKILEKAK